MKVLLFGSSYMAEEYLKVLASLNVQTVVLSRSGDHAKQLATRYGCKGYGLEALETTNVEADDKAIIASAIDSLKDVAVACSKKGIKHILVEKPGALNLEELRQMPQAHIAYNRRFFNSVIKLKELIAEDGGAIGCRFDFTEREKDILQSIKSQAVIERWGWCNSTHVIDAAFYLIGMPTEISCERSGSMARHPAGSVFAGSGMSSCPFSYIATWTGGGRWGIEVSTSRGRYKLCPLEELSFSPKNQFTWEQIELDDDQFKPGLLNLTKAFLADDCSQISSNSDQIKLCKVTDKIFGY